MVARRVASAASPSLAADAEASRERLEQMQKVAASFATVKPGPEVVKRTEAVPTVFPYFDFRSQVGGWPISKIGLVHGESAEGKSPFLIGLLRSFCERGHFALWGDFERATDKPWMQALMGPAWSHPGFSAVPPEVFTYEQIREMFRRWAETIYNERDAGRLPPDTRGIFCVDSIRKLMPKNLWESLSKEVAKGKGADERKRAGPKGRFAKRDKDAGVDGARGRGAMIKAGYTAIWMDELVPILNACGVSMAIIARETTVLDRYGQEHQKVGGGDALLYESHYWLQVSSSPVVDSDERLVGHRHQVKILRSKVGPKVSRNDVFSFHTSNGVDVPLGFDRARDLFELGIELGTVEAAGSYYVVGGKKLHGEAAAVAHVRTIEQEFEAECRAKFPEAA